MPYGIAAMSAGKVVATLFSKAELVIQGWDLLFMGSAVLTLVGLLLFAYLYRAPQPEETPLLHEKKTYRISRGTYTFFSRTRTHEPAREET